MPVPIIIVSRLNEKGDVIGALRTGAVDYIRKPFDAEEVRARVGSILRFHLLDVAQRRSTAQQVVGMLRCLFPEHVVSTIKHGNRLMLEHLDNVVLVGLQLTGFRELCAGLTMVAVVEKINRLYAKIDGVGRSLGFEQLDVRKDTYYAFYVVECGSQADLRPMPTSFLSWERS
jgi:response regulator RpfG family c-di-GMP phosphodiesterase